MAESDSYLLKNAIIRVLVVALHYIKYYKVARVKTAKSLCTDKYIKIMGIEAKKCTCWWLVNYPL
jgi:hypothetical protein